MIRILLALSIAILVGCAGDYKKPNYSNTVVRFKKVVNLTNSFIFFRKKVVQLNLDMDLHSS